MGEPALIAVGVAALLLVLGGLWLVDGRLLPSSRPRDTVLLNLALAVAGAVPWLVLAPLLDSWFRVLGPLTAPVAVLGAVATFLATLVPRTMGAGPRRAAVFALVWSTVVFVPAAVASFAMVGALDHGGSLAGNIAPGAAALAVLLVGVRGADVRRPALQQMGLPLGVAGVAAVVLGWIGWLVGAELAIDSATTGIVVSGLAGAAGGVGGWLVVERIAHQATTLNAVAAGTISGVIAITAGAPLFTPLSAVIAGFIAGGAAGLFTMGRARATRRPQWSVTGTHLMAGGLGVVLLGIAGTGVGIIFTGQPGLMASQLAAVALVGAWSLLVTTVLWLLVRPRQP